MDASQQFGQPRRPATRNPGTGGARVAGTDSDRPYARDAGTWVKEFASAGRNLTETYTAAIGAGVDPRDLELAFSDVADSIAGYKARHRRTAYRGKGVRPVIADAPGLDSCPDPRAITIPADYMDALRRFRLWAGKPSLRRMQRECGGRPAASTLCKALQGNEFPSLEMADAIIVGCGGRDEHREAFASAWRRLAFSQQDESDNDESRHPAAVRRLYSVT